MEKYNDLADSQLILAFKNGDAKAFEALMDKYGIALYRFCYRFTSNRVEAEDLLQDSYVKAVRALRKGTYSDFDNFQGWMYTIIKNAFKNMYEAKQVRPAIQDDYDQVIVYSIVTNRTNPESIYIDKQFRLILVLLVEQLHPDLRELIKLRYLEGLSYEEIFEKTGVNRNTIKTRIKRGREILQQQLLQVQGA